jgi:poly(A) polymerase
LSPRPDQIQPREAATWIAGQLRAHGHVAYFAGGCVRDRLLGIVPSDYDVVTDAHPDRIQELFRNAVGVGESFGVMLVRHGGRATEVATFRSDGPYQDGRHPISVTFSDERSDAARRDFTVNAIFEDPRTGELVDHFDGEADLRRGILRAVGTPSERMAEDHLRALRAVRFAARFGFEIESGTEQAIRECTGALEGVSRERIGGELRRMLRDSSRLRAVELLESFGMDAPVLLDEAVGTGSRPALVALGSDERPPVEGLAAWLLDRHGSEGRKRADHCRDALLLSNQEHRTLVDILDSEDAIRNRWDELPVAGRKRLASREVFATALELAGARDGVLFDRVTGDLVSLRASGLCPTPLIDGNDLIVAGFTPGPAFGAVLEGVYDAQLEGLVHDKASALAHAHQLEGRNK